MCMCVCISVTINQKLLQELNSIPVRWFRIASIIGEEGWEVLKKKKKNLKTRTQSCRVRPHKVCPRGRCLSHGCCVCIVSATRAGWPRLPPSLLPPPLRQICRSSNASGQLGWGRGDQTGGLLFSEQGEQRKRFQDKVTDLHVMYECFRHAVIKF